MKKQIVKPSRADLIRERSGELTRKKQRIAVAVQPVKRVENTPKAAKHFKDHKLRVTSSSVTHSWRTPKELLNLIEQVAGPIQLDPCADADPANHFAPISFTGPKHGGVDGLTASWRGHGVGYANPEYGRGIVSWIQKAAVESRGIETSSDHIFLLAPARVDTRWFQEKLLPAQSGVCFLRGRLKFKGSGGNDAAPFPSLLAYYGSSWERFKEVFTPHGWVTR